MKNKILIGCVLSLAACSSPSSHKNIEGKFAMQASSEYSTANDTIEVRAINRPANTFQILHRTAYQRKVGGKLKPLEHQNMTLVGVYNSTTAQLNEQKHGRVYSLAEDGEAIVVGSAIYKRIK